MTQSQVRQINIMISSTRGDLAQYRNEASKIIKDVAAEKEKQVQLIEVSMEKETSSGNQESAVTVSKRWVEESDWILLIVGWNYGTISDEKGYDDLSVTEWEYEHAVKLDKKLFVFIAGEPGTTNQYRSSKEEPYDLKDSWFIQTEKQREKLKEFKQKLGKKHVEFFANLHMFRKRLEKTLKDSLDEGLIEDPLKGEVRVLIQLMTPYLRDGILKVELINRCKQIHDYLHELLQHVIRPLREERLPKWEEEGTLSHSGQIFILKRMKKASKQVGGIKAIRTILQPNDPDEFETDNYKILVRRFNKSVDNVVNGFESWDQDTDSPDFLMSFGAFTNSLDEFAVDVQDAFSVADQRMTKEESDLRDLYDELRQGLKQTRQQCNLAPCDNKRIDEELKKIARNKKRVHNALTNHHAWQEAHDRLLLLDSYRETSRFDKELNRYRENSLSTSVLPLVCLELKKAESQQVGSPETEQEVCLCVDQPDPSYDPNTCDLFVKHLKRLRDRLEELRRDGGVAAFDRLDSPFNDAFYCVDKRTLVAVSIAGKRAKRLEQWLDALCKPEKDDD